MGYERWVTTGKFTKDFCLQGAKEFEKLRRKQVSLFRAAYACRRYKQITGFDAPFLIGLIFNSSGKSVTKLLKKRYNGVVPRCGGGSL